MKSDKTTSSGIAQLALMVGADAIEMPPADVVREVLPSDFARAHAREIPNQIHIERLILHKLDHWEKTVELADGLPAYGAEAATLFVEHIKKVIRDSQWDAHFRSEGSSVPQQCNELLGTAEDFIAASKQLAMALYASMTTKKITRGDFVAVVYRQDDEALQRIAIFKLDMETRLYRDTNHTGDETLINIKKSDGILPTPDSKNFTKCALLTPTDIIDLDGNPVTRYYIQLLDSQAGPNSAGVATFFYDGFLHAVLEPNARRHTHEFLRLSGDFICQHENDVPSEDRERYYEARREALSAAVLNSDDPQLSIDQFVEAALPHHPDLQDLLASDLMRIIVPTSTPSESATRHFSIDADIARPFVRKVILEADRGVRLIIPSLDAYKDMVRIQKDEHENVHRIVIETHSYREVER